MLVAGLLVELDAVMKLTSKLYDVPIEEAGDEKGEVPEVEDGMEVVLEPNSSSSVSASNIQFGSKTTSIPSSTSGTSPFSSLTSNIGTSSSFGVSSISASNSTSGPATSIFWSTCDPERAYRFGTTYNDHTSTESMEEDSMQTSTPVFDMSVDSVVAEDTHVHETGATLNNYDHTHMDMMVEDCMQTSTGETSVASPLFSFDLGTQPLFSCYVLHLDWWLEWSAKSNW
nr:hypothetical protein [Tanacetum cinerariifolium]